VNLVIVVTASFRASACRPENAPQLVNANPLPTTLSCEHRQIDNCPTHRNTIANLALAQEPAVYASGVAGHDHLMDFRGGPDFNIPPGSRRSCCSPRRKSPTPPRSAC
jgi:hypothetical protein